MVRDRSQDAEQSWMFVVDSWRRLDFHRIVLLERSATLSMVSRVENNFSWIRQ